jgi:hypothetical protein
MDIDGKTIVLEVAGTGIIFHSPESASHIADGDNYLQSSYWSEKHVQSHIQAGTIVGFCTGSPGRFILRFHTGYPSEGQICKCDFKLRLGFICSDHHACFRDLYDLLDWRAACPENQTLQLDDGIYHVTLCSSRPNTGVVGDNQVIDVYFKRLPEFPRLTKDGIPTLCM